jgi:hypothetical protein
VIRLLLRWVPDSFPPIARLRVVGGIVVGAGMIAASGASHRDR